MNKHVLVVEPRKEIIEDLEDRLESIGHTYDIVTSQRQAREQLGKMNSYSYIILSLDLPVKPGRPSKIKFGLNLFKEMQRVYLDKSVPMIVTLDRHLNNTDIAIKMLNEGAFVAVKPFEDNVKFSLENAISATLDSMIKPGIADAEPEDIPNQYDAENIQDELDNSFAMPEDKESDFAKPEPEIEPDDFTKPEMVFYKNRVELCGVTVCGDKGILTRRILDLLKERLSTGKYKPYSGYELAIIADCESGQQGISVCVSRFKSKVYSLLKDKASVLGEIIVNDRSHGYSIEDQITVIDKMSSQIIKEDFKCPAGLSDDQKLLYEYLLANKMASRAELESEFKMSKHAANRTLQNLISIGLIRCVGQSKSTLWLPVDK